MKVHELVGLLANVDKDLMVVLTVRDEDGCLTSWELEGIDLGWKPSGVLSLESTRCIIE